MDGYLARWLDRHTQHLAGPAIFVEVQHDTSPRDRTVLRHPQTKERATDIGTIPGSRYVPFGDA